MKLRILSFRAVYLPGYKSGGPIQSIANLVDHMGDNFCFRIVCSDRDSGESQPYPNLSPGIWHKVGKAEVCYLPPEQQRLFFLAQLMRTTPHDLVYLNSFWNLRFTTLPLLAQRLGIAPRRPVVLAPRGELSSGALALESLKKQTFIALSRTVGLHKGVVWQASSTYEASDIRRATGKCASEIHVASDMPRRPTSLEAPSERRLSEPLRIVFLSRIVPMKNLLFVIEVLSKVSVPVALSIFGPREDEAYWARCANAIGALPDHVRVTEHGPVPSEHVLDTLARHELFFLPTRGENYGHVIIEAMLAGLPVLISDQTPWRGLADAGVGRDLPLDQPAAFARFIEEVARMSADDYADLRSRVFAFANEKTSVAESVNAHRQMFHSVATRGAGA